MKYVVFTVLALALAACSDASTAIRALSNKEFKDIETTGYSWFSCSKDDFYSTGFIATNVNGKRVEGVVCSGLLTKGATIRYY